MISKETRETLDKVGTPNRVLYIANTDANGTHSLELYQTQVHVANTGSYTETITLPPVAAAAGLTFSIRGEDYGGGVTIQDRDDSVEWSDLTMDADNEYASLYSDGKKWHTVATDIS